MKRIGLLFVVFPWFCFAGHSLEEVLEMVENEKVLSQQIVVKFCDCVDLDSGQRAQQIIAELVEDELGDDTRYRIQRLFTRPIEEYRRERQIYATSRGIRTAKLENYYQVFLQDKITERHAKKLLKTFFKNPGVEFAYFQPLSSLAVLPMEKAKKISKAPTPNLEEKQFYLLEAPKGVDAHFAWEIRGGTGLGVKIIDAEFGWYNDHEEFNPRFWNNGLNSAHFDHGTAVWGEIAAKRNEVGVTGIAYDAEFGTAGWNYQNGASSYDLAGAQLGVGDILVIEEQNYGPYANWAPMEYWQANFDVIQSLTNKGVIVIAAAGNGTTSLDWPAYGGKFDLNKRDSGAILVGAGASPNSGWHLRRLGFSNYGKRIDAMAYGDSVVTAGYGGLFNGGPNRNYTSTFSGTSSATPIVVGSVASIIGMAKAQGMRLSPADVRLALRLTGTCSQYSTTDQIGCLPNLKKMHEYFFRAQ